MADINKRYIKISIWSQTFDQFKSRHKKLNEDIRSLGIKKQVPFTRFLNVIAKQGNVTLDRHDLNKIATRRKA